MARGCTMRGAHAATSGPVVWASSGLLANAAVSATTVSVFAVIEKMVVIVDCLRRLSAAEAGTVGPPRWHSASVERRRGGDTNP